MNILKRHSFWVRVIQSGQIILGSIQGITLATEKDVQTWNVVIAGVQAGLGILSLWTADNDNNDVIDVVEDKTKTTIVVESKGPVTVKDVTTENPNQ